MSFALDCETVDVQLVPGSIESRCKHDEIVGTEGRRIIDALQILYPR